MAYELTGKITDISVDIRTNKPKITLSINERPSIMKCYEELRECDKLSIKIGKYREKRSLDANAYCWLLIGKLAEKLNIPVTEIYRDAIKEIGGNREVVCVRNEAVDKLCRGWEHNGLGWQTDTMPSKIDGCTNVILYYGSSTYDTKQMYDLTKNIVELCQEQGIDTRTPEEIEKMLALMGESDG